MDRKATQGEGGGLVVENQQRLKTKRATEKRMNLEVRKNEGDRRTRGGIEGWVQEQQRE